ncbi:hypothetical protein BC830DRAFT_906867 [Chytriomyces sp. MP71]|nr:hypothetical protein BC830DRAFT_906867 [Chytriomyces sp. MP71]
MLQQPTRLPTPQHRCTKRSSASLTQVAIASSTNRDTSHRVLKNQARTEVRHSEAHTPTVDAYSSQKILADCENWLFDEARPAPYSQVFFCVLCSWLYPRSLLLGFSLRHRASDPSNQAPHACRFPSHPRRFAFLRLRRRRCGSMDTKFVLCCCVDFGIF